MSILSRLQSQVTGREIDVSPTGRTARIARQGKEAIQGIVSNEFRAILPTAEESSSVQAVQTPILTGTDRQRQLESYAQLADDRRRSALETELYQLTQPGRVYNEETTARNRARVQEIENELSTLRPRQSNSRLRSGVQSILATGAAALPVLGDTLAQLNQNTADRAARLEENGAAEQLASVNQQIRALEGNRTGEALDYIRAQDQWKALDAQRQALQQRVQDAYVQTPVSQDAPGMRLMREAGQYQEQALEGLEGAPRFLGETALSIGQNAILLPTAAINPAVPLAAMGAISAAGKTAELNARGLSPSEALTRGAVAGGIEAATEKIPLENLLSVVRTGGTSALRNLLRQAGIEAGEESVSYLANYIADRAAQDPEAEFSLQELARSAAGGALSGGVFGGAAMGINALTSPRQTTAPTKTGQTATPSGVEAGTQTTEAAPTLRPDQVMMRTQPGQMTEMPRGDAVFSGQGAGVETEQRTAAGDFGKGLIPLTEQEAANLSTGKNNIVARTFQDIVSFVKRAKEKKGGSERLYMGTIPESAAQFIRSKTGMDVSGYTAILPGSSVQHIIKNHGNAQRESARGQRAVTEEDIALVPIVLAEPDTVVLSDETDAFGRPVLMISKQIGDAYITAQAVTDGRHMLATNSLWIQKRKNPLVTTSDAGVSADPAHNAQSVSPSGSSTYSIPADGQEVNQGSSGQVYERSGDGSSLSAPVEGAAPSENDVYDIYGSGRENLPETAVGANKASPWTEFVSSSTEFIPEGANAARDVDVPTKDPRGRLIRRTASTAMGAKAIPDEAVADIQNMVLRGELSYNRVTDKASIGRAIKTIEEKTYAGALEEFRSAVSKGVVSKDIATLGQQLLINAANAGDEKITAEMLSLYAQMETTAGQAVQAASILRKLSPTAQLYSAQKAVDQLNDTIKKPKRNVSKEDNVPVEIWMQRIGENLADSLAARVKAPKETVKTVSETILSDLRKFSAQTAPKRQTGKSKRTEIDRITDLFQNKDAYNEAWQAAKDTLSDTFENEPDALAAFDAWLDSSLDYSKMLTKELTGQTELRISENLVEEFLRQTDQEGRDIVLDKIYQNIADQVPSTWKDKWNAWRYLAMLANPRTHVRNVAGNVFFQPLRIVKDRVAAAIEAGVSAAGGGKLQRTKSFLISPELYRAAWGDWANVRDVLSGNKYDDIRSEINSRRRIFRFAPLEAARTGNSWLLEFEDSIFKRITYADALAGYLQANGVTAEQMRNNTVDAQVMSRARDYAAQEALRATYQDRNAVSDKVVEVARVLGPAGEAILPFKRTPANILVRGMEYSPAGLAKALTADLVQVRRGNMTGAEAIDHIASGLTGSALFALGAYLFSQGIVTSGGGDDENEDRFNELTGSQNYALNLPDGTNVTLDWLAPEALPFFMGVELMDSMGQGGNTADSIMTALKSISDPMLELSMLQSLNDVIDSVSFSENKLGAMAASSVISYFTQAIPTIGGQIERSGEDVRMSTYTDKNLALPTDIQYAIGRASARIPGVDYQQIPYIDAWGREESSGPTLLRMGNNFLNPAYTSRTEVTPVDEEIRQLYNRTGDGGVVPDRPPRYITVDGERVDLTAEQYVQYATDRGQMQFRMLEDLFDRPEYNALSSTDRAALVNDVYEYVDKVTKAEISDYELDGWVKTAAESGVDPEDYLIFWAMTANITGDKDENGDTISGSKKEKMLAAIDMMDLSVQEKDALYYALGYSESTLRSAPWH